MKLAICILTRDKIELVKQALPVLLDGAKAKNFDLFIIDGSTSLDNEEIIANLGGTTARTLVNIRGGADTAVIYALNFMLDHANNYTHVGLVELDVVLRSDWFAATIALFDLARADGLTTGAVSARSYEDRVLFQRDGYAVMHNLGFGTQILTRVAAEIFVRNIRSWFTTENRRVFMQLAGLDIGRFWAFGTGEHWLVPDWGLDRLLAQHGLASVALTPARCNMVGQDPPLAAQGLRLVIKPVTERRWPDRFATFRDNLKRIRECELALSVPGTRYYQNGSYTIFTHHLFGLGAVFAGDWRLKWAAGFGPFAWQAAAKDAEAIVPCYGSVNFVVGSATDSEIKVEIEDLSSGYRVNPTVNPKSPQLVVQIMVPGNVASRKVRLRAMTPDVVFYAITTPEPQPIMPHIRFHHSMLPPP